jgi:hypothetical protein
MTIAPQTKSNGRERVTFSYKTKAGTRVALVLSYLMGKVDQALTLREGKQRATDAMLAFWLPYAMQGQQLSKWNEMQQAARRSIESLTRQVKSLCADFQVESPWETKPVHPEVLMWLQALVDGAETNGISSQQRAAKTVAPDNGAMIEDELLEEEAIFVDDDELLGDLF